MSLYQLTERYETLLSLLEDDTIDESIVTDALTQIGDAIETDAEELCKVIRMVELDAEKMAEEEKRIAERRKKAENRAKRLKEVIKHAMEVSGKTKIKGALFTISRENAGGKQGLQINVPLDQLPSDYVIKETVLKANNDALRKLAKNGKNKYCELLPRAEILIIR